MTEDFVMPFKFLGFNGVHHYYLPRGAEHIVSFPASGHGSGNLMHLAPLEFWQDRFGGRKGVEWATASDWLIQESKRKGHWDSSSRLRGLGVWRDGSRIITHCGTHLCVDGERIGLSDYSGRFVYELSDQAFTDNNSILSDADAQEFLSVIKACSWDNPICAHILAGWCVVSSLSGLLDWRPHVWLNAYSGSGKSYILNNIVMAALGKRAKRFGKGITTIAGINRSIGQSARPIVMDELEIKTKEDREFVEHVLTLTRSASSGDVGTKADQFGRGVIEFEIKSSFLLSSINNNLTDMSDLRRFTIVELKRNTSPNAIAEFDMLQHRVNDLFVDDFSDRFFARSLSMIEIILQNAVIFQRIATKKMNSRPIGDQIGILLAGAYSLISRDIIHTDLAEQFIEENYWDNIAPKMDQEDHDKLFDYLMTCVVRVNSTKGQLDMQIKDCINCVIQNGGGDFMTSAEACKAALAAIDIRVTDKDIRIRKPSHHISRLLKSTPFYETWPKLLCRISGICMTKSPERLKKSSAHYVIISHHLMDDLE